MSAGTLTCRCRFCGYVLCYSRDNIGLDARCSRCGQTIRLPGRLSAFATIKHGRNKTRLGLALEIGGFVCMPFFFPWGLIVGLVLLFFGWRKSNALKCEQCGATLKSKDLEACPQCGSKFTSE